MTKKGRGVTEKEERQKAFMERFRRELALRPEISDEEFMRETEVSDAEYARGFGAILPAGREPLSMEELAEEGYMDDMDPAEATILFQMWKDKGISPDELEQGYEDMKSHYIKWLKECGIY